MNINGPGGNGADQEPPEIDTSVAHVARVYDYLLGGTANFKVDREAAERAVLLFGTLEMVEPGVVQLPQWYPEQDAPPPGPLPMWCGVGRKPTDRF